MLPGKFRPTLAHAFIKLLDEKGLLLKCFTQNIDTLERETGLTPDKIVESHGSFATHRCIDCKTPYPDNLMREAIQNDTLPLCRECNTSTAYVKPDIVFFGESLPADFFDSRALPEEADLCIVMGTSLTVQPFALLPSLVRENVPRLLVNLTEAGDMGSRRDDVLLLEECDIGADKLATALGWEDDLQAVFERVNPEKARVEKEKKVAAAEESRAERELNRDESLHRELEKLTLEVDEALHTSTSHLEKVKKEVRQKDGPAAGKGDDGENEVQTGDKEAIEGKGKNKQDAKEGEKEKPQKDEQPQSQDSRVADAASHDSSPDREPENKE